MTKDHKITLRQRHDRNLGIDRRIDNAGSARTEAFAICQHTQLAHGRRNVKGFAGDSSQDQFTGLEQTGAGQVFLSGAHHHVVDTGGLGAARPAETRWAAGLGLQFERDVLQNMANPGALLQAPHEATRLFIAAFMLA